MRGTSGNGGFTPIEYPASEGATVPSPLYYPAPALDLREFGNDLEHHHHHAAGSGSGEGERERAATKRPEPLMLTPPHNPDSEVVELLGGNQLHFRPQPEQGRFGWLSAFEVFCTLAFRNFTCALSFGLYV